MTKPKTPHPDAGDATTRRVHEVITQVIKRTVPAIDTDLAGLGVDSVTMLEVLVALEDRFNIVINENTVREFRTVQGITRIVKELIRSQ